MTRYGDVLEISNSEVQSFADCPRRWWLTYVRGLRPKTTNPIGPLPIGSRIHKALEEGFSSEDAAESAMQVLHLSLAEDLKKAQALGIEDEFLKEAELCIIMLEGFIEWASEEGFDDGWKIVEHERIVRLPSLDIDGQTVVFKGKLDQLARRTMDGTLWFRDWKTCQTLNTPTLHMDPQMRSYMTILKFTEPTAKVTGGQYVQLRKVKRTATAKPPFYDVKPVYISDVELESFWRKTMSVMKRIVEAERALANGANNLDVVPSRPSRDCSWRCPFFEICPMFDDGSRVEDAIEALYVVHDPYEYYGELGPESDPAGGALVGTSE